MDERTVIRHQQHAGRVVIQPSDGLQLAPGELLRQQRQYAGVMTGFARTFKVGWLVQHDVDVFAITPDFIKDREFEVVGIKSGAVISHAFAIDADFAVFYQVAAVFSGTESLRLQDTV